MIKKILLCCCFASLLTTIAQPNLDGSKGRTCGTPTPSNEWNTWFNAEVARRNADIASGKVVAAPWVIPIIVHIIHNGQPVGTADNISQAQVVDQVNILNADFAGTGLNNGNAPAVFAPVKANFQISFCLAVKDPTGGILPQPGIDRVDRNAKGFTAGPYSSTAYINSTIKPATIWDPIRYCNVWVLQLGGGLLGYATFPAGTSLAGVTGGGSATDDGVVILNTSFGSVGTATVPPYHKGRTITHELGHWLGLRHVWGDGTCLTDYCTDTPPAQTSNFGCPTFPFHVGTCAGNTTGEMTMNFMDYTDDLCMYMFTNDQKTRAQTAMTQGTFRSLLGTHGLCSNTATTAPGPAVASFSLPVKPCVGQVFYPANTSSGTTPTYSWSSSPATASIVSSNIASPAITFTAAGNYTLTLVATNTTNTSSYSLVINNVGKCSVCLDTIRMIKKIDTLITYKAPTNALVLGCQGTNTGFLTGTNCYNDKEFAQFYPAGSYSDTPNPQISDVIVLFDSLGTNNTATTVATQIYCKLYGGTAPSGPNSFIAQRGDSIGKITATMPKPKSVTYCGTPTYTFTTTKIIPFKFTFTSPAAIPSSGFFASVQTPYASINDSIRIFSDTKTNLVNDSSSWVLTSGNNWKTMRSNRGAKVQLAIMPIVSCRPIVGIKENVNEFTGNVNIMPNPNNGMFNLVFTLPNEQKINVRIYNALGQEISNNSLENVTSNVISINISDKPEGIYFISITNGTQKTVKKVIVSH